MMEHINVNSLVIFTPIYFTDSNQSEENKNPIKKKIVAINVFLVAVLSKKREANSAIDKNRRVNISKIDTPNITSR